MPSHLALAYLSALAAADTARSASVAADYEGPAFDASVAAGDACLAAARALVASGEESETSERAQSWLRGYEAAAAR